MTQADVLTAIDDALDTGMATEPDAVARELQELALLLRADSPEPTDAYSEWLDERVSHEFASPREARSKPPWWRPLMQPAAAVLVIAVAVAGVGLLARGLSGASDDSGGSGGGVADSAGGGLAGDAHGVEPAIAGPGQVEKARSRRAADQALSGSSPAAVLPPHPGGEFAPGRADRRIERSFSLELESPVDEMQRVADQVTAVTNRHGGFVLSSSVSTGEDSSGGDFNLRIPASEVRPALRDLARLADVVNQNQTGRDVTPSFVTARDRLRSARAERKSLLRRL